MAEKYDVVIIGAGMSGMAAAIRLARYGKRTLVLEKHAIPGGLNSYYSLEGRRFDVGLHAMTNFVPRNVKSSPLGKLLRQLRIRHEELDLVEQNHSLISFPEREIRFGNSYTLMEDSVADQFPAQIDNFRRLAEAVRNHHETDLNAPYLSAREVVRSYISDPLLEDMLFCPVMYYGSAVEEDMDFSQFCIMFRSVYFEGFCRPEKGVRHLIRQLRAKLREAGAEIRYQSGVRKIVHRGNKASAVLLEDGSEIEADLVFSSAGLVETDKLIKAEPDQPSSFPAGQLSFVESLVVLDEKPATAGFDETIVFFCNSDRFNYRKAQQDVDFSSGVICLPDNFRYRHSPPAEGMIRFTCLANFKQWDSYTPAQYAAAKEAFVERQIHDSKYADFIDKHRVYTDAFTPTTVKRFTSHENGAIYGSPQKIKDGRTELDNVFLMGTDQGFLGIVGALLSGISMANLYGLK